MIDKIEQLFHKVHKKRFPGQILSKEDLYLLLADSLIDQRLFLSPNWEWLYDFHNEDDKMQLREQGWR